MTHAEAQALLPAYALGALADDPTALEAHLRTCDDCTAHLATYLVATTKLAEAAPSIDPPTRLRERILANPSVVRAATRPRRRWPRYVRLILPLVAALFLSLGLGRQIAVERQQLAATRTALALDTSGLDLLTSTETANERLAPVIPLGATTHGHWFHRPGITTQVLVVEAMPPPPAGEAYYGWFRLANGSVQPAGRFMLDSTGYGRLILVGSDGTNVRSVFVTRQSMSDAQTPGAVVLQWPTP